VSVELSPPFLSIINHLNINNNLKKQNKKIPKTNNQRIILKGHNAKKKEREREREIGMERLRRGDATQLPVQN